MQRNAKIGSDSFIAFFCIAFLHQIVIKSLKDLFCISQIITTQGFSSLSEPAFRCVFFNHKHQLCSSNTF